MAPAQSTVVTILDRAQTRLEERYDTRIVLLQIQCVFRALEPWANADSPHPKGKAALELVKAEVARFPRSLTSSLDAAQLCYDCADNGTVILGSLIDHNITVDEIRRETEHTLENVVRAKVKLFEVVKSLRTNRTQVFEARKSLEVARTDIDGEKAAQKVLEEQAVNNIRMIKTGCKAAQVVSAVVLAAASPICPPLLIAIPVVLPLLHFIGHTFILRAEDRVKERSAQLLICTDAVNQIHDALHVLEGLETSLDSLASWWGEMEMIFRSIHVNLEAIRREVSATCIRRLIQSFTHVMDEFRIYKVGIEMLQDYFSRDLN